MNSLYIPIGAFFLVIVVLATLRAKLGSKFDTKNGDIILALIPVVLWLLASGTIKEFAFGDLKIVAAIQEASQSSVESQVATLPIEDVRMGVKGGVGNIHHLIDKKTEALGFQMGHGRYLGTAIEEYLKVLTAYPYLRYVVVNDEEGDFLGMTDARQMAAFFRQKNSRYSADWMAKCLNESDVKKILTIPGLITLKDAVTTTTEAQSVLTRMNELKAESLPVVDGEGKFAGMIQRSELTASMLIDIAGRLENQ